MQDSPSGHSFASAHWGPVTKGRIDFLELFAGSARLSRTAALSGLKIGTPVDLRTGFDILTSSGRQKAMNIVITQKPKIVVMAPYCAPWSQLSNINDREARDRQELVIIQCLNSVCRLPCIASNMVDISSLKILRDPQYGGLSASVD